MITLPRQLQAWQQQLSLFPQDMALVIGELAARVALVLGAREEVPTAQGTPDGIGGLSRRGTYDRLLATEWLIQQEVPEEFMRRVVSGEHTFLERAYSQDSAIRNSLVLFDSGPEQLGAPRVVQIAVLIALAQRAQAVGARFRWGVLQDPAAASHDSLTQANIREFLRLRSTDLVSQADFERWSYELGAEPLSELWLVGAQSLAEEALNRKANRVEIEEELEIGEGTKVSVGCYPAKSIPRAG
jgi:hypothetical protein